MRLQPSLRHDSQGETLLPEVPGRRRLAPKGYQGSCLRRGLPGPSPKPFPCLSSVVHRVPSGRRTVSVVVEESLSLQGRGVSDLPGTRGRQVSDHTPVVYRRSLYQRAQTVSGTREGSGSPRSTPLTLDPPSTPRGTSGTLGLESPHRLGVLTLDPSETSETVGIQGDRFGPTTGHRPTS